MAANRKKDWKTILIAEDDTELLKAYRVLFYRDYNIITCENGKDLVELLDRDFDADLIILDILMPEMNGPQTLIKIREKLKDIPVIIVTGIKTPGVENIMEQLGSTKFFLKPFDDNKLKAAVKEFIG